MRKDSALNLPMLIISIAGAVVMFALGESLMVYFAYVPYWLQCGVYMGTAAAVCCAVMFLSEIMRSGRYILKYREEFGRTCAKAAAMLLPAAVVLGVLTQLLYGFIGISTTVTPNFQGTMLVSDISGSMTGNDPNRDAIEAMLSYIDTVPLNEYLGIIVFNELPYTIREYAPLSTEDEREQLKRSVADIYYEGGTDIQEALLSAISQLRTLEDPNWQGLVILFSDGLSSVGYAELQRASLGNVKNIKNRIPVNTIFYSSSPFGGYQMSTIAQKTGGTYFYAEAAKEQRTLQGVFSYSRSIFSVESPHLIQSYFGAARTSVVRVILQFLFIALWGSFLGALTVLFLNNKRLLRHYLILKIVLSVVFALIFAIAMLVSDSDMGAGARFLLAFNMCVIFIPTYKWE